MKILEPSRRLLSDDGISTYIQPAIGECDRCGKPVELWRPISNTCTCGAQYNMSGQRLRDSWVTNWAEETGETEADIFAGDYDPEDFY